MADVAALAPDPVAMLRDALAGEEGLALDRLSRMEVSYPGWDEPPLRRAEALRRSGRFQEAEAAFLHVLGMSPTRREALLGLAGLLIDQGQGARAQSLLLRRCGHAPDDAAAWDALGVALVQTGDHAAAEAAFTEAQVLAPGELAYALKRVEAACTAGSAETELARLNAASAADPLSVVHLMARGVVLDRLGRRDAAIDMFEAAAVLAPDQAPPVAVLGRLLARTLRLGDAEQALRRAIALDPADLDLRYDRAVVLLRLYRYEAAREELIALDRLHEGNVTTLCNLAAATTSVGMQAEALGVARQAIAADPASHRPRRALCQVMSYAEKVRGAEMLAALQECAARLPRGPVAPFANEPDPKRRLRVGLLSPSLKVHPVGWLTIAGFETLDPAQFDLIAFAEITAEDHLARRFRQIASVWHDTGALSDAALAALIRAEAIDVLIDLGGHGDSGRLPVCAQRPAPVQVKWVGCQYHSTGLPEMDWLISDRWETPPDLAPLYTERLLILPDGYVCYSPPPYAPDVGALPALARGHVTFGCFNNLAKVTPRVLAAWSAVLRQVPESRLVLKAHQVAEAATAERLRAAFAAQGIGAERVEFRGGSRHRALLDEYNDIDIVLDPFPYTGGLTTIEALWMGVPTITMPGEIFAARHAFSHLVNVGLADWVAEDEAGYVALAVRKAADLPALAALRAGLRVRVKASPLCDAPRFGRNLGAALRHAWAEWCRTPRGSDIQAM